MSFFLYYVYIFDRGLCKMILLKKLLLENEDDINSDLWDDWVEYIKYNQDDLPKEEIKKLKSKFNLMIQNYLKLILKISDPSESCYIQYNPSNETFDYIKDIQQWVYDLSDVDMEELLGYGVDKVYSNYIDCTLEEFKKNPGKVYHYTTEDKWEAIQKTGHLKGSTGTGLTNRYSFGLFTSTDPEEYASGTYGDVCLEIDLSAFKNSNNLSEIKVSYEPDVEEYLMRDSIRSALELDNMEIEIDSSGGMSPYTLIINHSIPIQYVSQI